MSVEGPAVVVGAPTASVDASSGFAGRHAAVSSSMAAGPRRCAASGLGAPWPAQLLSEAVRIQGCQVEGVGIRFAPVAAGTVSRPLGTGDSDEWSVAPTEDDIPDELLGAGGGGGVGQLSRHVENVATLRPMQTLQSQHAHNPNLVRQFGELAVSFKAWRPVRGDGNCYYRALLFAWLERCVALGNLDSLRNFDAMLRPHRQTPVLSSSARTVHAILQSWVSKRAACASEAAVRGLLLEVAEEFNKEKSDRAMILCLRHLVADYLRQHARDPVAPGQNMDQGNVLTYESWAIAISGAKDIDDYCEQHVYIMNKDAADHVQHVCPRVLRTAVRICMVDRETARCNFIDYGEGTGLSPALGTAECVGSAAQLASIGGPRGLQPEIFLLLKPGHYDILVPRDDTASKLLEPPASDPALAGAGAAGGPGAGASSAAGAARPGAAAAAAAAAGGAKLDATADAGLLRKQCDARWRGLVGLTKGLCGAFQSVVHLLEEKLAEELASKRKRLGSIDESLFEGQLTSVLDPLVEALRRLQCVPEDSAFSAERRPADAADSGPGGWVGALLPSLQATLLHTDFAVGGSMGGRNVKVSSAPPQSPAPASGQPRAAHSAAASPMPASPAGATATPMRPAPIPVEVIVKRSPAAAGSPAVATGSPGAPGAPAAQGSRPPVATSPAPIGAGCGGGVAGGASVSGYPPGVAGAAPAAASAAAPAAAAAAAAQASPAATRPSASSSSSGAVASASGATAAGASSSTAAAAAAAAVAGAAGAGAAGIPVQLPAGASSSSGPGTAAAAAASSPVSRNGFHECCICMQYGARVVAPCGCAYHPSCLTEYAEMEGRHPTEISCHLHDQPLGASVAAAAGVPGAASSSSSGAPGRSEAERHTNPFAEASSEALSSARPIGLETQLDLANAERLAAASASASALASASASASASSSSAPAPGAPPAALADALSRTAVGRFGEGAAGGIGTRTQLGSVREGEALSHDRVPRVPSAAAFASAPSRPVRGLAMPTTGNLGVALGVPCVICFGEEGILKTLHCGYKAHITCLKSFWSEKVCTLCRLTNIRCPAEVAGCTSDLGDVDLRGVVSAADVAAAECSIRDVDAQNRRLIDDLKRQSEEYRPMFSCAICLVEHEIEGCCTLPCGHRFCFEALQYHFDIIVRERRLNKLSCPAEGCGCNLRSEESIHIFHEVLSKETYHKLHEFLTRDNPHIYECKRPGCEERVFLDDGDDFADLACAKGHRFCGKCDLGPHPQLSCEDREEQAQRERKKEEDQRDHEEAWRSAVELGWKPCPRRCTFAGGYKAAEECDHVTCECGFEFCWDCGVERQIALAHDNRWHKPSCRYHTPPHEVTEKPVWVATCPACKLNRPGVPCSFPADDGYPRSYISRRSMRANTK